MEAHPDNVNLLYLTDSEATLQVINKWIGGGAKLNLAKTADTDVLKAIIVKLQQRVKAKVATLLVKVKAHRRKRRGIRQRTGPSTSGERPLRTKTE